MAEHLWIVIVLLASALQTGRNAGQKHLSGRMSALSATWVRFGFGLPVAAGYLVWVLAWHDRGLPAVGSRFLALAALAAFLQIAGTALLVFLFRLRNFAVGSTYVRSEVIVAAIVGAAFFGERNNVPGWIAIVMSVSGVVLISLVRSGIGRHALIGSIVNASAGVGLLAGLCFALSSFVIREASLSFQDPDFAYTAATTLITVITLADRGSGTVHSRDTTP